MGVMTEILATCYWYD